LVGWPAGLEPAFGTESFRVGVFGGVAEEGPRKSVSVNGLDGLV